MNHTNRITENAAPASTYSLLVRSEEKSRSAFETAVYIVVILSSVFSIWKAAQQPIAVPSMLRTASVSEVADATATVRS